MHDREVVEVQNLQEVLIETTSRVAWYFLAVHVGVRDVERGIKHSDGTLAQLVRALRERTTVAL